MDILYYLLTALLGGWMYHELFDSPKARIKGLWKKVFKIAAELGKIRKETPSAAPHVEHAYNRAMDKHGKMINALLDYHFDPESDAEYIKEYLYKIKG